MSGNILITSPVVTGETRLIRAVRDGDKNVILFCLADYRTNVNLADKSGKAPLYYALLGDHPNADIADLLFDRGAIINDTILTAYKAFKMRPHKTAEQINLIARVENKIGI